MVKAEWNWVWQGLVTNWLADLLVFGGGVILAILKKRASPWFQPIFYGLASSAFLMIVLIALGWPVRGAAVPNVPHWTGLLICSVIMALSFAWFGTRATHPALVTTNGKVQSKARESLVIHYAGYGVPPDRYKDVTHWLKGYITQGAIDIIVTNETMGGDPQLGLKKMLRVEYSYGKDRHVEVLKHETDRLILPLPTTVQLSETVAREIPHLACIETHLQGLYDIYANVVGYCALIKNVERRYDSMARNVRAVITFIHHSGDRHVIDLGVWLDDRTDENSGRAFAERVSISMGRSKWLVLVIANRDEVERYAASAPVPPRLSPERQLRFGEWAVQIMLLAENMPATRLNGCLQLSADGSIQMVMEDGATR